MTASDERSPSIRLQRIQNVKEDAIEDSVEKSPKRRHQKIQEECRTNDERIENSIDKSPKKRFQRVQDVIENVIDQCNPPKITTGKTTVISCIGNVLQPTLSSTSSKNYEEIRPEFTKLSKFNEDSLRLSSLSTSSSSSSSIEGYNTRLEILSPYKTSSTERFRSCFDSSRSVIISKDYQNQTEHFVNNRSSEIVEKKIIDKTEFSTTDKFSTGVIRERSSVIETELGVIRDRSLTEAEVNGGFFRERSLAGEIATGLFRDRSAAETEAAHDLLELSRSLPPLPQPSVAIGPQNVIDSPSTDVQEMTVCLNNFLQKLKKNKFLKITFY